MAEDPAFDIQAVGQTDVGQRRDHNEDSFLVDAALGLFIVADGMGGHAGGGTASRLAVDTIQRSVKDAREREPGLFGMPRGVARTSGSWSRRSKRRSSRFSCAGMRRTCS